VTIALCLASLSLTGFPIIWGALKGLVRLQTNVDELVSLAIIASLVLQEWISGAVVAFIMVLGGLIEEFTSERARRHLEALTASTPRHAVVLAPDGSTREVAVGDLEVGQTVLIRPGDVVPADGVVVDGASEIDESALTGESRPVAKAAGEAVASGTVNIDGSLQVELSRVGDDTTHARIRRLVEDAERHRAPVLRQAERYARWFTPAVLVLSGAVWAVTGDVYRAVTMLIVGCPCAFVLATPTAVVAALGRASREGILIKGGKFLEAAAQVRAVALDKTGTLTTGSSEVHDVVALDGVPADALLSQAARLEVGSEHPVAQAIVAEAERRGYEVASGAAIQRIPGLGVVERSASTPWSAGNSALMGHVGAVVPQEAVERAERMARDGLTPVFVAEGDTLRGLIALRDELRPEAAAAIASMREQGFEAPIILTGDLEAVAHRLTGDLGIPEGQIHAGLLPQDKYVYLRDLEATGQRVCYAGDGTNDGPALAVSSVGVSIGSRRDTVALETADAVLMRGDLRGLPFLLRLGRATARTINVNLILFGLLFNASMLVLSASGVLTPVLGAIGHNLGSVAVVLNSARLLRFR
jgi:Zn2+/Cd2+-exporting ATPase